MSDVPQFVPLLLVPSCMGGWCKVRDVCPLYCNTATSAYPVERVCALGADGQARGPYALASKK